MFYVSLMVIIKKILIEDIHTKKEGRNQVISLQMLTIKEQKKQKCFKTKS